MKKYHISHSFRNPNYLTLTGQVVETANGPCFVPGKIVETEDRVTFISGQVVETPEGLKFIAPDMKETDDEFEFNLQGFQVSPEELALFKPKTNLGMSEADPSQFSIDDLIFRQLAEAGMSIGRQVESETVDIVLQSKLNSEVVEKFCDAHHIDIGVADQIFKMVKLLTDEHKGKITAENLSEKIMELIAPMMAAELSALGDANVATAKSKVVNSKQQQKSKRTSSNSVKFAQDSESQVAEANQIVNVLTKVMIAMLKNEEVAAIDADGGSLISQHHVTGGKQKKSSSKKVESIYEIIANVLHDSIGSLSPSQLQEAFSSPNMTDLVFEKLSNTINKVETMCHIEEMKTNLLNSMLGVVGSVNGQTQAQINHSLSSGNHVTPQIMVNDNDFVIEQFCDFVEDLELSSAFSAMSKNNPQLLLDVLNTLQSNAVDMSNPNVSTKELIQKAIIASVNAENNSKIDNLLSPSPNMSTAEHHQQLESVFNEALMLAKVLNLNAEALTLITALDKAKKGGDMTDIVLDEAAKAVLRRVIVMKQLAEVDPDYKEAFELLHQSPHRAVKDEIVRELVRKSGLVSIESTAEKKSKVETSKDIPMSLLVNDNILAMEDFMLRTGSSSKAFLIIKDGIQCVIPREKSHDVLTGKCAFTVLDENGIRHFEPMHVMSALKMNAANQHHRFSMYATDATLEELSKLRRSSCSPTYDAQTRDFQFSACDFADNNSSSDIAEAASNSSDGGELFGEFFVENVNYDVDPETGYRRPRRRRHGDKDDPTAGLDFQTTQMLRKRRGARADRKSKSPITTQVYRQYQQVNDNIYIMHAYVYHQNNNREKKMVER